MKTLWLINSEIPCIAEDEGIKKNMVNEGWVSGMMAALEKQSDVELYVLYPQNRHQEQEQRQMGNIHVVGYYRDWKPGSYHPQLKDTFEQILRQIQPDVIHVMGTEYPHSLSMCEAAQQAGILPRLVLSLQGVISKCAEAYCLYLPWWVKYGTTLRDLRRGNVYAQQQEFARRGKYEIAAIQMAKHVIGRTEWDHACVREYNSDATYHFNNEVLRPSFYLHRWKLENCRKHTLFMSQGSYPIKGLHMAIQALAFIKARYPDVVLRIAGDNILIRAAWRRSAYPNYIASLIKKYDLQDNVVFLDKQNEQQMCQQLKDAHVLISSSVLENSPNSVGEGMLLGMPVVSSDVGGVKDFIHHGENGFIYPSDEPYMLAEYVMQYFENEELAKSHGSAARETAEKIFDTDANAEQLVQIYRRIARSEERQN